MYILGIGCYYHDSSACLLKDGVLVAAAEEERFTRKKHDTSFPLNAIEYCLKSQDINIEEVRHIGFYEKPLLKFERVLSQHVEMYPRSLKTFIKSLPSWMTEKLRIPRTIRKKLGYTGDVLFVEHHMAHAASCFLVSPFDKAAILTADGVGEWTTTSYGIGSRHDITLLKDIRFPHSLGLLYSTITAYLGFTVNNSEYKVMGLAAFGESDRKKNKYFDRTKSVLDLRSDGSYSLDMSYFTYHFKDSMPSRKLCALLGGPVREPESKITKRHKDIAAALQMLTEEALTRILTHVHEETEQENLVIAGGLGLNSVFNGKILRNTPFKKVWIQPAAGDGGGSLGAAFYVYNMLLGNRRRYTMDDAYFGPAYDTDEVRMFLNENNIKYTEIEDQKELIDRTVSLLLEDKVLGWFQGRMEWGPRALGNRSILSNPLNPKMKQILNQKVKHREEFRPFAPVVCSDDATKYFECDTPIPAPTDFMLMVYPIKKEWRAKIPSVTHVDGSGRLQTIRREQNPLYYDLIKQFGKRSGIPMLINTSFNIRGEPIVCTPEDAYRCMMGTGIDCTVMDRFLIMRGDNSQDKWDSEKMASD